MESDKGSDKRLSHAHINAGDDYDKYNSHMMMRVETCGATPWLGAQRAKGKERKHADGEWR